MRPRPVTVLAVVESVLYGLVARHAYDEGQAAAVPLTFVFLLLLPMMEGYRGVASGEVAVGTLPSTSVVLMLLTGAVFGDIPGLLGVLAMMPFFLLMALLGGALAVLVRAIRRTSRDGILSWSTRIGGMLSGRAADSRLLPQNTRPPRGVSRSGARRTTAPSGSGTPRTSTSDMKGPI